MKEKSIEILLFLLLPLLVEYVNEKKISGTLDVEDLRETRVKNPKNDATRIKIQNNVIIKKNIIN